MNNFTLNEYKSMFLEPLRIVEPISWITHVPFAFFITELLKPKIVVELGVHTGNSFSAFCQAVKDLNVRASCYGVDTFKGDPHSGVYDESVYLDINNHITENYGDFAQVMRVTFDEALEYFSDGSIDLLHIDGYHTYEAVKHDFESWLPKMSDRGVILLHDTQVRMDDFGVWKLWGETSKSYPSYEFKFGYGLGVLAVGENVPDEIIKFIDEARGKIFIERLFFTLGANIEFRWHIQRIEAEVVEVRNTFTQKDDRIRELEASLEGRNLHIQSIEAEVVEVRNAITQKDDRIRELEASLEGRNLHIQSIEAEVVEVRNAITQKDDRIRELEASLEGRNLHIQSIEAEVADIRNAITQKDDRIRELETSLEGRNLHIQSIEAEIVEVRNTFAQKDDRIREIEMENLRIKSKFNSMKSSVTWRTVMKWHSFIDKIMPHGTRRRRGYDLGITGLMTIANEGWRSFWWKDRIYKRTPKISIKNRKNQKKLKLSENTSIEKQYIYNLFNKTSQKSSEYVPLSKNFSDLTEYDIKLIAFYLPQFHPIPENDEWWGKGFTDWTNVSKAVPQFIGHYQPRLPDELGFYDLRLVDVQKRQVELAKQYGIYGFCFYYYWFNGRILLEKPLKQLIQNPEIDFPFCICWANENWTRRWDGLDNEILMKQKHSKDDNLKFIEHVSNFFKDSRYIKIDRKPLLIVYRPNLFPNPSKAAKEWREYCKKTGIGDIYLVAVHSSEQVNPLDIGYDATIEFPPLTFQMKSIINDIKSLNPNYQGQVHNYRDAIEYAKNYKKRPYKKFRGICPCWDNEARKPGRGIALHNSSPSDYKKWLEHICYYTDEHFENEEKLIFVNAWNEWAEAAYLEPDRRYGYAYLEATRQVLEQFESTKKELVRRTQNNIEKSHEIAIILHLYYLDQWSEIRRYLLNLDSNFDLYISINSNCTSKDIKKILKEYPKARFFIFENRGRDILPFLRLFKIIYNLDYNYICKIHSKKSPHRADGSVWRRDLLEKLLGSKKRIAEILDVFNKNHNIGMVIPGKYLLNYKEWIGSNENNLKRLCNKFNINYTSDFLFPGGSMFWFRPKSLKGLLSFQTFEDFEFEDNQIDGVLAHAFERLFGLFVISEGFEIGSVEYKPSNNATAICKCKETPYEWYKLLHDDKWFELIKDPDSDSVSKRLLPGYPSEEIQLNFTGMSGIRTMNQAFEFYNVVKEHTVKNFVDTNIADRKFLDFGCGWGRIIRFFLKDVKHTNLYGCDCVRDMIVFCNNTNKWCNFFLNDVYPPLPVESNFFDVVYCYSVFSHLAEDAHNKWLEELHRILKPEGLLVLTTRRESFIDYWVKIYPEIPFDTGKANLEYRRGNYVHMSASGSYNLSESYWGETAIPREYIEKNWNNKFEILSFIESGRKVDQNIIIARKRGNQHK